MYRNENEQLLKKAKGYLKKQSDIIPQEGDYKVVVDKLNVSGKEYPMYRLITNGSGKTLYLMDHALPGNVVVTDTSILVKEIDPDDEYYYIDKAIWVPSVSPLFVKHLARVIIADLKNFFAVKKTYGESGLSNFDYLKHHLPQANLKNIAHLSNKSPFVLVKDTPPDHHYIPGVVLNEIDKGLVNEDDAYNYVMCDIGFDTLIVWKDDKDRPNEERFVYT